MKLNKQGRDELRKSVEVLLNAAPDNKKIQLSNETLEQLLFDTYVVNKEKGIKVKLPVWSGDFLRKLDLSRVSFEDVSWFIIGAITDGVDFNNITERFDFEFDSDFIKQLEELQKTIKDGEKCVNYANTNAKIDFKKSFDVKLIDNLSIYNCNFLNVDLSSNQLFESYNRENGGAWVSQSNFANTNIGTNVIHPIYFKNMTLEGLLCDNNLENISLNELREVDGLEIISGNWFVNSNLRNTGLHIKVDTEMFKNDEDLLEKLRINMENYWVGCYVNGVLVKSPEERKQSSETIRQDYEQFKNNEIASVLGSISEQLGDTEKKR